MKEALLKVFKRLHDPLSLRHIEEMMHERGVFVDHTTIHRWLLKILPVHAAAIRRRKRPLSGSWRMDEAYVVIAGQWKICTALSTVMAPRSTSC